VVDGNTSGDFWGAESVATSDDGYQNWSRVGLGTD
jgi:hypothetical protein